MIHRGAIAVLSHCDVKWIDAAHDMLEDPDGAAILALLCNALSKENALLYAYKPFLLLNAIKRSIAADREVWTKPHTGYGDYPTDTVVFIQTPEYRMQWHVRRDDPVLHTIIELLPYDGRGWDNIRLQDVAKQIAHAWLESKGFV